MGAGGFGIMMKKLRRGKRGGSLENCFVDRVLFEEKLNRLKEEDSRIREGREAAVNWVRARLSRELREAAPSRFGLDEEQLRQFGLGEEPGFGAVEDRLLDCLGLAGTKAKQYRALVSSSRSSAAAWLWNELVELELSRLPGRLADGEGIPGATWWRFRRVKVYTSPELAGKICAALGLGAAEEAELRELFLRGVFEDVGPLRESVRKGVRALGMTVTAFREGAYISRGAWLPFEPAGTGTTSQGTLLKLVIGLRLTPEGGWSFLAPIHSGFYMDCDLIFLTYMHYVCALGGGSENYVPEDLAVLIEELSRGTRGKPLFDNPYGPEAYSPLD